MDKRSKCKTRNYKTPRGEHRENTLRHKSQQKILILIKKQKQKNTKNWHSPNFKTIVSFPRSSRIFHHKQYTSIFFYFCSWKKPAPLLLLLKWTFPRMRVNIFPSCSPQPLEYANLQDLYAMVYAPRAHLIPASERRAQDRDPWPRWNGKIPFHLSGGLSFFRSEVLCGVLELGTGAVHRQRCHLLAGGKAHRRRRSLHVENKYTEFCMKGTLLFCPPVNPSELGVKESMKSDLRLWHWCGHGLGPHPSGEGKRVGEGLGEGGGGPGATQEERMTFPHRVSQGATRDLSPNLYGRGFDSEARRGEAVAAQPCACLLDCISNGPRVILLRIRPSCVAER